LDAYKDYPYFPLGSPLLNYKCGIFGRKKEINKINLSQKGV
jgi:hypothetical protein